MNQLFHRSIVAAVLWLVLLCGEIHAQSEAGPLRGPAMGVSMDRFMSGGSALVAMSYRYSWLNPGGIGAELGVSVFPQALPAGALATAPDLGASYNLPVPGGSLLIKAGGSALAVLSLHEARLVPGAHLGGTLLLDTGQRSAVRLDLIHHYYRVDGGEITPVWSIGLGFAILSRRR